MTRIPLGAALLGLMLGGSSALGDGPPAKADSPQSSAPKPRVPEAVEMAAAIVAGSEMGPHDGWFHPGEIRYDWAWLAGKFDKDKDGAISFEEYAGPEPFFDRLDRDRDGLIKPDDLDWSDRSMFLNRMTPLSMEFRRADANGNGRVTRDEWLAFFDKASRGQGDLVPDDLREALLPTPPRKVPKDAPSGMGKMSAFILLRGLARAEIGSPFEGPHLGDLAPDFTLTTRDRSESKTLSAHRGKPVVLVFGNFTCGPFRAQYASVDRLQKRYGDRATFLGVYVREAHPTDGWRMDANDWLGVAEKQPTTFEERAALAGKACELLKTSMPLLVDELDDRVGNAYSGMPSRLYVIDAEGKVVYKSGRGPFGFRPGEMEQSLVMTLLDEAKSDGAKAD
jgi:thiol-disulfide isomerase/thioredoxin